MVTALKFSFLSFQCVASVAYSHKDVAVCSLSSELPLPQFVGGLEAYRIAHTEDSGQVSELCKWRHSRAACVCPKD
jgi:hypothetical protein